jgi:hypothetical protein
LWVRLKNPSFFWVWVNFGFCYFSNLYIHALKNIICAHNPLRTYLSGSPRKMYMLEVIRSSINIDGIIYHDVPDTKKIQAQEVFDNICELLEDNFVHVQAALHSAIKVVFTINNQKL